MDKKLLQKIKNQYRRKAIRVCYCLKLIPFLRMVGLNGSMVRGEFSLESDIDFIIITEVKRIYFVRQLMMFFLTIFSLKRSDANSAGKICPNRWATTHKLRITPTDDYHAWTFSSTIPIYAQKQTYDNFILANRWMEKQGFPIKKSNILINDSRLVALYKNWLEKRLSGSFGNYLENIFKKNQIKRIDSKTNNTTDRWNIRINNDELCFHLKREYVKRNLKPPIKTDD